MEYLLLFFPLLFITYEDFRHRAIHWVWLVLLTAGIVMCHHLNLKAIMVNLLLMGIQLAVLTLYFSFKEQRLVFLPKQHLGWGDILFYIPLCLLFSPGGLILFLTGGFVVTLLAFGFYNAFHQRPILTIPLAGCLSACLIGLLMVSYLQGSDPGQLLSTMLVENAIHP